MTTRPIEFTCQARLPISSTDLGEAIADVSRWPSFKGYLFLPGVDRAEYVTRTPDLRGSRIRVLNTDRSSHTEEIIEWQPDRRIVLRMAGFSPPLNRIADHFVEEWLIAPAGQGINVTRSFSLVPRSGFTRPVLWLIARFLKRAVEQHLAGLAAPTKLTPSSPS